MSKVQTFRTKPQTVEAIQFDGKNTKTVVEFIRTRGGSARSGGTAWVKVAYGDSASTVKKHGIVSYNSVKDEFATYVDADAFRAGHTIPKTAVLV